MEECEACLSEGCSCDYSSASCGKDLSCGTQAISWWNSWGVGLLSEPRFCWASDTAAKIEDGVLVALTVTAVGGTGGAALGLFASADVAAEGGFPALSGGGMAAQLAADSSSWWILTGQLAADSS
ncbi:unnamed protein product [Polarella glacialis]|uniref:Uncharacterized protein n=1 Tax=Polarella glacialis TaxID=89957 RepID=A0A813KU02_POLGL|nr:unnamed protein product [Polarella glacialis]